MAWTQNLRAHSLRFHPDGGSELIVGGITNMAIQGNPEILAEISAGQIMPGTASLQTLRPVASFTSFDLSGLLGVNGPGLNGGSDSCIHGTVNPGVEMFFAYYDCAGPGGTGTVHRKYQVSEGIIVPTSLTVDHRGNAQLSYDIYMNSDGVSDPVVKTSELAAALPTLTNNNYRWTMDAMTVTNIGATAGALTGKRNINISFNPSVTQEGADSTTFDSVVALDAFRPKVTITGVDPDWLGTIANLSGHSAVRATTVITLVERNGAVGNITIAFDGLISFDTVVQGGPESPAQIVMSVDVTEPSAGTGGFLVALA